MTLDVDDLGHSGNGGSKTDSANVAITTIANVNDDPSNTGSLPADVPVTEDVTTPIDLSAINLADPDAGSGNLTMTLTTASGGSLTASSSGGVTVTGSGTVAMTLDGTLAALNAFLDDPAKIQYLSTLHAEGDNADTVSVNVTDNGNTGSGGGGIIPLGTVNVDITPVNDAPELDNTGTMVLTDVIQDSPNPPGNSVASIISSAGGDRITDVDSNAFEGIAVTGVDDNNGIWEYSTDSGANWDSLVTDGVANGTTDDTSTVLLDDTALIRFVPNPSYNGPAGDLTFRAWDQTVGISGDTGVNASAQGGSNAYSINAETATLSVIAAAGITNLVPGDQDTDEDTSLIFSTGNGNSIMVDDGSVDDLLVRTSLSVTNGTLTLATTNGLTFESGADGTPAMTISGLESDINAALDGLEYTPDNDYNGPANLQVITDALDGLIARYTFDNPANPGNDDSPGGAHDGTVMGGATTVPDAERGSDVLQLDGTNDYIIIPGRLGSPQHVTLAAWVNLNPGLASKNDELISIGDNIAIRLDQNVIIDLGVTGFYHAGGLVFRSNHTGTNIAGTGWHHVVYTVDTTNDVQVVYIDGVAAKTENFISSIDYSLGTDTFIGRHGNSSNSFFLHGKVDDARIYDRALSAAEVVSLFAGAMGSGGSSDTDQIDITVNPIKDAPVLTVVTPALTSINEDDINNVGDPISSIITGAVADVDDGSVEGIAIIGVNPANGTWAYTTTNGASWNPVGVVTNGNARLLAADANTRIRFEPNPDYNGTLSPAITFRAWDQTQGINGGIADTGTGGDTSAFSTNTDTAELTVNPENDPPVATITQPSYPVIENTPLDLHGTGLAVSDPDAGTNAIRVNLSVSLRTLSVNNGTTGVAVSDSGTGNVTLIGTLNQLNDLLSGNGGATITYDTGSADDTLTLAVDDLGHSGNGGSKTDVANVAITTIPDTNDDPSNTGSLPANLVVTEDVPTPIDLSAINLADPDAGSGNLSMTLTTASGGLLTASNSGGVTVGGSGTSVLTLDGTLAALNAYLTPPLQIQYQGVMDVAGNGVDNLTINVTDNGHTGSGGGGSIALGNIPVNITPVNDDPVAHAGGPYPIDEGDGVTLNAALSTDIDGPALTYHWELNGDNSFDDATGIAPSLTWAQLQSFGINDGDQSYPIEVRVEDGAGGSNDAAGTIQVTNVAPVLTPSGANAVTAGQSYTLNLSVNDPGDDTITSWVINWGDGTIDTVPGNPASTTHIYTQPGFTYNILASATDEDGTVLQNDLVVPSYNRNSIFRFQATTGNFLEEFANANGLDDPIQAIIGPDGKLYVSGEKSDDVLRYDPLTGAFIDIFVTNGSGGLNEASGMTFGPDGHLYVSSGATDEVLRFDGATGAFVDDFVTSQSGGLRAPYSLTFGPDGHLYVASFTQDNVLRFDGATGAFIDIFVTAGSGGLNTPEQLTFGPDGHLYVASLSTSDVLRYHGATGAFIDMFVTTNLGGLDEPAGLAFGPDGHLYVADYRNDLILRYDGTTGAFIDTYVSAGSGGLDQPIFTTFLPQHQVHVNANIPPMIDLPSGTLAYTENSPPAIVDAAATLSDPDSLDFDTGTLTVDFTAGGAPNDRLEIRDQGSGAGNLTIDGIDVRYDFGAGPIVIGTVVGGTSGLTPLDITLNANANAASVEAILRNVTYENVSDNPETALRTVRFVLTDGDGGTSNAESKSITLTADNDDPSNTGALPADVIVTEDAESPLNLAAMHLEDPDADTGNLTLTLSTSASGTLTASSGGGVAVSGSGTTLLTLTGTIGALNTFLDDPNHITYLGLPNLAGDNADTLSIHVNDNGNTGTGGGSNIPLGNVNIDITASNDPPTANIVPPSYNVLENTPHPLHGTGLAITDIDAGSNPVQVTLSVGEGTIAANPGTTGALVSGSDTASVALNGTLSQISDLLDGSAGATIFYQAIDTPSLSTTFTLLIDDLGSTGGGSLTDDDTAILSITAENDLIVDTTSDVADGNTSSITALLANRGADSRLSLREVLLAANNTPNGAVADGIEFNIPLNDANHVYYRDDGIPDSLSLVVTTTLDDASISDFDPDYPGTPRSWYRISPAAALPIITETTVVDGTTQPGYIDAPIIELDGSAIASLSNGLGIAGTGSTIRGLVINRFTGHGLELSSGSNTIEGNYIGLDVSGSKGLGNDRHGLLLDGSANNQIGGTAPGTGNVISGNGWECVQIKGIGAIGNTISGNDIGTDISGTLPIPCGAGGIVVGDGANNNTIGGPGSGDGNVIAFNSGDGIKLEDAATNSIAIQGNHIFSNTGLGIDLNADGITTNDLSDSDSGANNQQNFPFLTSANSDGAGTFYIGGAIHSTASRTFRIEFFANATADASGHGEGETYLGSANATTDASGDGAFSAVLAVAVPEGSFITATATDLATSDTSEFSAAVVAQGTQHVTVGTTSDVADGDTSSITALLANRSPDQMISLREAILAANNTPNGAIEDQIDFNISDLDPGHVYYRDDGIADSLSLVAATQQDDAFITDFDPDYPGPGYSWFIIQPATSLPNLTEAVSINGYSQPGASANTLASGNNAMLRIEIDGTHMADGLHLDGDNVSISGLIINRASTRGIVVGGSGSHTIEGNFIGTDATGTMALGNNIGIRVQSPNNTIGGTTAAARNVISGNAASGLVIATVGATGNHVQGNFIGTDASGTVALGNAVDGIQITSDGNTIGGTAAGAANGISGNNDDGVSIANNAANNILYGNAIGTDLTRTLALGNGDDGITLFNNASDNIIGGIAPGQANTIAFMGGDGIQVAGSSGSGNTIRGNAIYSNGSGASDLGIDLGTNGVTPNDAGDGDTGPNDLLNFPVITSAVTNETDTLILNGTLNSLPSTDFDLDFYYTIGEGGEGAMYLGSFAVFTDASGHASFNDLTFTPVAVPNAAYITATATVTSGPETGNTSEFSEDVQATVNNQPPEATIALATYAVNEDSPLTLHATGMSVSDPDAGANGVEATLSVGEGTLTVSEGTTGVLATGSGTGTVVLDGSITQINDLLAGNAGATIAYTALDAPSTSTTLSLDINDLGHTGAGGAMIGNDTATLNITAENDDPSNTGSVPAAATVTEDDPTPVNLSAITLSDADAAGALTVTLFTSSGGTLSALSSGGVMTGGSGTSILTLNGTLAALNTFIDTPSQIQYLGAPNAAGNNADDITIQVTDNGHTGSGGGGTIVLGNVSIHITPVGDTPIAANAITPEDTLSAPIAVDRHAADGPEVTHFRISNITNGVLYQNDGTTPITNGDYILVADGQLGLRFQPAPNSTDPGSFDVESSEDGSTVAAQSGVATATITVNPINDAPELDNTGTMTLTDVLEDDANPPGDSIASIIASAGGDRITDVDSGAVEGIAVIGANDANGTWSYTLNGTDWNPMGAVSNSTVRLLAADANTRIRFLPNPNYNGVLSPAITFRAWDQTQGSNGGTTDTGTGGGSSAFSTATEIAGLTVTEVNDPPTATIAPSSYAVLENTPHALHATGLDVNDLDAEPIRYGQPLLWGKVHSR